MRRSFMLPFLLIGWMMLFASFAWAQGPFPNDSNVVALYHCDEESGTQITDASPNGNHGTIHGATRVPGRFGNGLQFDGIDDFVRIARTASLDVLPSPTMTIEAWVKISRPGRNAICEKALVSGSSCWPWTFMTFNGSELFALVRGCTGGVTGPVMPRDDWHYVALVYDHTGPNAIGKLYIDGSLVATNSSLETRTTVLGADIYLGANYHFANPGNGLQDFFQGTMDEIRISNNARAITLPTEPIACPTDVATDATTEGYWTFNSSVVTDDRQNGKPVLTAEIRTGSPASIPGGECPAPEISSDQAVSCPTSLFVQNGGDELCRGHVEITNTPPWPTPKALTLEAWIYPLERTGPCNSGATCSPTQVPECRRTIISRSIECEEGTNQYPFSLRLDPDSAKRNILVAAVNNDGTNVELCYAPALTSLGAELIPYDEWTYVGMTYDGATIRLYVNGEPVASKAAPGEIRNLYGNFVIGAQKNERNTACYTGWCQQPEGDRDPAKPFELPFNGYIDDVRVSSAVNPCSPASIVACVSSVAGTVTSDCQESVAGAVVTLRKDATEIGSATVAADGQYEFENLLHGAGYSLSVLPPDGFGTVPESGPIDFTLTGNMILNLQVTCLYWDITGTLSASCGASMAGVTVDLFDKSDVHLQTEVTDAAGRYTFSNVRHGDDYTIMVVTPLGYIGVDPVTIDVHGPVVQNFTLQCIDIVEDARTIGFWKHNVSLALQGRTNGAQESSTSLANYASLIFQHFHANFTHPIDIEGVTFRMVNIDGVPTAVAVDLATMNSTLNIKQAPMLERAKQQYLALLLNVASGRLATSTPVSSDGRTCSQAITYVSDLIQDGIPGNDELAKSIADTINNSLLVAAGLIPEGTPDIAYKGRTTIPASTRLVGAVPSPFNPTTRVLFDLQHDADVRIRVFTASGKLVRDLVHARMSAGHHNVVWDGNDKAGIPAASGVYYVDMDAGAYHATKSAVLLK